MKLNLMQGLQAGAALAKIGTLAVSVASAVIGAMPGGVTADEAEQIARDKFAAEDLKVKVGGVDIIDDETQSHLVAALARVARNLVHALTGPKAEGA